MKKKGKRRAKNRARLISRRRNFHSVWLLLQSRFSFALAWNLGLWAIRREESEWLKTFLKLLLIYSKNEFLLNRDMLLQQRGKYLFINHSSLFHIYSLNEVIDHNNINDLAIHLHLSNALSAPFCFALLCLPSSVVYDHSLLLLLFNHFNIRFCFFFVYDRRESVTYTRRQAGRQQGRLSLLPFCIHILLMLPSKHTNIVSLLFILSFHFPK